MAEIGNTVCVRGLPTDMDHERLEDKLLIHFLRERNGGGEISKITLKAADPCAMITFEDSRVAFSVCSHKPQVLKVDGKTYELSLSFPWQDSQHLNKVFLDVCVTIDCSHFPLGEKTIKTLTEKFTDIGVHYLEPLRHCTLKGPYSVVNYVITHLIELLVDFVPPSEESLSLVQEIERAYSHQKEKHNPLHQPHGLLFGGDASVHQDSRYASRKVSSIQLSQTQTRSDERTKDWIDTLDVEALSLIMEADVFAYLSSRSEEYRTILQNHGVYVVDVTSAGVSTLYLQTNANSETGSKAEKHLSHARKELSQLYQKMEGNLRRAQIPKSALNLHGDQNAAFKDLESLLPKVLLNFDQTHIYIIGESSDVSQAKQILLFGLSDEKLRTKQETIFQSSPSYSSVSESEKIQKAGTSRESNSVTLKKRISDAERRFKNGEEYKLAARFKNSDIGLLGFGPVEKGKSKDSQDLTQGINTPALAPNSTPGTEDAVSSVQARASQVSAFKVSGVNNEDLLNEVSRTNSASCTSRVTLAFKGPLSTHVNAHSGLGKLGKTTGSTVESTTTAMSTLKRTSSCSGRPVQKQETQKPGTNDNSGLATNSIRRQRSTSLNCRISAEALPSSTVSKSITVPTLMWSYLKQIYYSEINFLISDVQVSENIVDKYKTMVILKGSASSKVEECQQELQKLVDAIGLDFCVQKLKVADLGATEGDDMFKEGCLDICSYFSKIVLLNLKDDISLLGPRSQCSQAKEMLQELFPSRFLNSGSFGHTSITHQESTDQRQAKASSDQTPIKINDQTRPNQTKANSESSAKCRIKGYKSESRNVAYKQTPMPVANEMQKAASDLEITKTGPLPGKSSEVSGALLGLRDNWQTASSLTTQKSQNATTLALKQTNVPISKQLESCVCGENGTQRSCGVFLCSNCIQLHAQCMVCSKANAARNPSKEMQVHPLNEEQNTKELKGNEAGTRQKEKKSIHGTMSCTELSVSLPGYEQYRTAKITYCIPDGIQEEEHPNPGLPFQGAVFEAYLPLSSQGQELLQCLEQAFKQGFTFTVCPSNNNDRAKITWSRIPHKTNITGGKSRNGYPDVKYLKDLSEALRACGIKGV